MLALLWMATGCDDEATAEAPAIDVAAPDGPAVDAAPDVGAVDAAPDLTLPDLAVADAAVDAAVDAAPDAGPPPRCSAPPPTPPRPVAPLPRAFPPQAGIDAVEQPAWAALRDALMADPTVHFVATFDQANDRFLLHGGPPEARASVVFNRVDALDHSEWQVLEGDLSAIFPNTAADAVGDYDAMLAAFEPAPDLDLTAAGYPLGDPRVGFLPYESQSWPDPLVRLGTLFEAPDAPDIAAGVWPWANGGVGSHGSLGVLQSQATFVVSGRGARAGAVIDAPARLVDAAPTVLAALGAPTTGGLGPDGRYDDGLYLLRQDGWPRWDALDPDPCARPEHVVLILFDGLQATELNHLMLDDAPPVDLPTFRTLAHEGAVFRHGAVVGFPSISAGGHTTAGTGAWPGHHGVVDNAFWGRAEAAMINPFQVLTDLPSFFAEPARFWALYDRLLSGDAETLAQATHRALGPDAFVAVLNEIAIGGADYTTLDHFGVHKAGVEDYERIDALGGIMVSTLLGDRGKPVPTLLQLSFLATDGAGEGFGPHSPRLREALQTLDGRIAAIRALYAARGVLDDTMFVLVSDHGMELMDPRRTATHAATLRASGVKLRALGAGTAWLATLDAAVVDEGDALAVTVTAHGEGLPVADARVTCEGCAPVQTDAEGRARLAIDPAAPPARLQITHPSFTARDLNIE
ncbi:MAG: alkaline phosphatase family protein [Myxococcales bacterium]|nr:alkaline phosphatase family protein [Myxococcales bacterium]